jgi:hypothetical protein
MTKGIVGVTDRGTHFVHNITFQDHRPWAWAP